MQRDAAGIRGAYRTRIGVAAGRHHVDEPLVRITLPVQRLEVELARDARIQGRMDATDHRRQMRHEREPDIASDDPAQALRDFDAVTMPGHAVGFEVVRGLGKQDVRLGLAPRSAYARLRISDEVPGVVAVAAAFLTIITKEALYRYTVGVGGRLGSPAILASAKDHRKDAITSVSTLVGVTGAYFGLAVMDPLAAGLTSFFIFHIGYETFMTAAHDLMDGRLEDACVDDMVTLAESVPGVEHVHEIKCRRSGQYLIVDLKLDMDAEMTVKRSHAIATDVKKLFFERFHNVGDVMIHINPHEEEHEDLNRL